MITAIIALALIAIAFFMLWNLAERDVAMYHTAIENARMRGLRIPGVIEIVDEEIYPVQDAAAVESN